jgi:hypothetical protein
VSESRPGARDRQPDGRRGAQVGVEPDPTEAEDDADTRQPRQLRMQVASAPAQLRHLGLVVGRHAVEGRCDVGVGQLESVPAMMRGRLGRESVSVERPRDPLSAPARGIAGEHAAGAVPAVGRRASPTRRRRADASPRLGTGRAQYVWPWNRRGGVAATASRNCTSRGQRRHATIRAWRSRSAIGRHDRLRGVRTPLGSRRRRRGHPMLGSTRPLASRSARSPGPRRMKSEPDGSGAHRPWRRGR